MARLPYRSFCYTDWLNEFMTNPVPFEVEYLDRLVDEVADGGADVLVFNPNGQTTGHPSRVWQTMWQRFAAGPDGVFGSMPEEEIPHARRMLEQMVYLAERCDILEYLIAGARRRGIAAGVSLRMNDVHFSHHGQNLLVSDFHFQNPQYRIEGMNFLDYSHPQVREHYLKLVREIVFDYAPDVLDLDFLRNPVCLPPGTGRERSEILTGFVREARKMIREAGDKTRLLVRLPYRPDLAAWYGFDVATWVRESLIDGVVPGSHLHSIWHQPASEWKARFGEDLAVYPTADFFSTSREAPGSGDRTKPQEHSSREACQRPHFYEMGLYADRMRGFASGHLAAGADGIYWFNFVVVRQASTKMLFDPPAERDENRPQFEAIGESNTLESLARTQRRYCVFGCIAHAQDFDPPTALPLRVPYMACRRFELLAAAAAADTPCRLEVLYSPPADGQQAPKAVPTLRDFNKATLYLKPREVREDPHGSMAVFDLPAELLRDGLNTLVFSGGEAEVDLLEVDLVVG